MYRGGRRRKKGRGFGWRHAAALAATPLAMPALPFYGAYKLYRHFRGHGLYKGGRFAGIPSHGRGLYKGSGMGVPTLMPYYADKMGPKGGGMKGRGLLSGLLKLFTGGRVTRKHRKTVSKGLSNAARVGKILSSRRKLRYQRTRAKRI